jgi:ATP synthase protein I
MNDFGEEKGRASEAEFHEKVGDKADRKLRARRERARSLWFGLGTFGMVGWSIAIPAVIGALVGRWIDANWPGPISWTLVLLLVGLAVGCFNAWRWVCQEMEEMQREEKE